MVDSIGHYGARLRCRGKLRAQYVPRQPKPDEWGMYVHPTFSEFELLKPTE